GSFQYGYTLDIVRVEARDGVPVIGVIAVADIRDVIDRIRYRDAVDHEERLVVAAERGGTPDNHADRRAHAAGLVNGDSGYLAAHGVQDVLLRYPHEFVGFDFFYRIA